MKLLLDANISWRLCSKLISHFEDCFQDQTPGCHSLAGLLTIPKNKIAPVCFSIIAYKKG